LVSPIITVPSPGAAIIQRHWTLEPAIGTFQEEKNSYMTAILLMSVPAPAVTLCAVADWALFWLYQDRLHPWASLLKEVRQFYQTLRKPVVLRALRSYSSARISLALRMRGGVFF
jgi:hypothetical protein